MQIKELFDFINQQSESLQAMRDEGEHGGLAAKVQSHVNELQQQLEQKTGELREKLKARRQALQAKHEAAAQKARAAAATATADAQSAKAKLVEMKAKAAEAKPKPAPEVRKPEAKPTAASSEYTWTSFLEDPQSLPLDDSADSSGSTSSGLPRETPRSPESNKGSWSKFLDG